MAVQGSPSRVRTRGKAKEGFLERLLDPIDLLSEAIYSILILLTFTLAFRIFTIGLDAHQAISAVEMNDLLLGAVGATLAWGIIDGVMYALTSVLERGQSHRLLRRLQAAQTEQESVAIVANEFDFYLEPITAEEQRQKLYVHIQAHLRDGQARPVGFKREDFTGALASVVVAMVAVFPAVLPLLLLRTDPTLALRASNVVSLIVLFIAGYYWGRYTDATPWKIGLLLVAVALIMVLLIAIPLGG